MVELILLTLFEMSLFLFEDYFLIEFLPKSTCFEDVLLL